MYEEDDDIDWTDDVLGNFSPQEWAVIDKGYSSECRVTIVEIGPDAVLVQDAAGQQFEVNILRLSKP